MKKRLWKIIFAFLCLLPVCSNSNATTMDFYTDGTITDGNVFDTVNIWDTATVGMTGGYVSGCYTYDTATLNYIDGDIQYLVAGENSTVNTHSDYDTDYSLYDYSKIYLHNGGSGFFQIFIASDNVQLHIYGYDLIYTPDDPGSPDFIDGYWEDSHQSFNMRVRYAGGITPQVVLHEIPEPSTGLLLASLILLVKLKRSRGF